MRDLQAGTNILVSVNRFGTDSGNSPSDRPFISADGRYVVFRSAATDLVAEEVHGESNIYVRDLQRGVTTLVSRDRDGTGSGNDRAGDAFISADGRIVVFQSTASDLVAGDSNFLSDVFYFELPPALRIEALPPPAGGKFTIPREHGLVPGKYRVEVNAAVPGPAGKQEQESHAGRGRGPSARIHSANVTKTIKIVPVCQR